MHGESHQEEKEIRYGMFLDDSCVTGRAEQRRLDVFCFDFCFRDFVSCIDGRLEPTAGNGRRQKSILKIITLFL